ncbi:acetate--CoA ligase family protein [Peribacillus frigoritolerans]|uniref:acetate--CoA ligase family protein n=1 Tax=Peribacillus frigoritolerans TaxID=450367 RepID=UPI003818DA2B
MSTQTLSQFFSPQSVVIVGASNTPDTIGNRTIKNFADLSFKGKVFGVNPRYQEVMGFPCYPTVTAIPESVDVAIIAIPSDFVESAIRECIEKKVKYIIIFSSGFAEKGEDGLKKQNDIITLCQENGIRVLGPNTFGGFNIKDQIAFTFGLASSYPSLLGDSGLISQSGATGILVMSTAMEEEIGFTYMISTGNQPDLNTIDFLEFMVEDQDTNQIGLYLEGIPDGEKLKQVCEKALSGHKPIVVLKAGNSEAGKRAALSHTASLTGSTQVFHTAAERYGMIEVKEMEEMVDALKAFKSGKRPKGNRVATVAISGASGIMLADRLSEYGLQMTALSNLTMERLVEEVPSYCSVANPVDIGQSYLGNKKLYKHCIQTLALADEVDIVVVQMAQPGDLGISMADDILEVAKQSNKPIIVAVSGTEKKFSGIRKRLNQGNVPAYSTLKSAAKAAYQLIKYEEVFKKYHKTENERSEPLLEHETIIENWNRPSITEPEVKTLLQQVDIQVPSGVVVTTKSELQQKTKDLRYPLVAKIVSSEITHKSDVGGVIFPIVDEDGLIRAYETIRKSIKENLPLAKIDGILVEEVIEGPFLEVFVGVNRDPVFGPVILCGLGGVYVEVMKDISQRLAPISEFEALQMIKELKSYPLFTGVRKGIQYDIVALAKTLSKISHLAMTLGEAWTALEINPLIVRPEGQGVVALDGLITTQSNVNVIPIGEALC